MSYDLIGQSDRKHTIWIEVSDNFGRTFRLRPRVLSGDVGKGILPGRRRQIRWEYLDEHPEGLEGEGFVFAVNAKLEKGSSAYWVILGAGIVGVVIWIIWPKTGDIELTIPGVI